MAYVKTSLVRSRRIRWLGGFQFCLGGSMVMAGFPPVAGQVGENGDRERAGGER